MKRALFFVLSAALLAGTCLAQTKAAVKPGARPEMLSPLVATAGTPQPAAAPSKLNFPNVQYPRIEADNRVTFRFNAPDAKRVQVSIVNVPFDMTKGADGVWTYTSAPQAPGYHNYWMIVDGAVVLDPATNAYIGYSHMCNGFEVPEPGVDWYDLKDVPHGNVLIKNYYAKSLKMWRRIFVYTPPGYDQGTKRYPVLYLQHGGGEDERVWIEMGRTNVILDNMLAKNQIKPFIVVMETSYTPGAAGAGRGAAPAGAPPAAGAQAAGAAPARGAAPAAGQAAPGGAGRGAGAFGMGGPNGGAYGQLMVNDLIPWVDANFRTIATRDGRGMAGLSMGGMQTASVTMANLDKFSHVGLFSGGAAAGGRGRGAAPAAPGAAAAAAPAAPATPAPLDLKTIYNGNMANPADWNKKVKVFYFSCGSEEYPDGLKRHQEQLQAAGITNSYVYVSPGTAHEWQTWRRSLYSYASLLFR